MCPCSYAYLQNSRNSHVQQRNSKFNLVKIIVKKNSALSVSVKH